MVLELFLNAVVAGILLGGFYAAVALGLSITFGQLDIVNIAHPAFVIVGSFTAYIINDLWAGSNSCQISICPLIFYIWHGSIPVLLLQF